MWSDIETKRDYLNFAEVAEAVTEILLDPAMRPVSVGVFGTWGTGKSSVLNLIEAQLNDEAKDEVILIRFDAWLYQGYDDARAALMEVIARMLYEQAKIDEGILDLAKRLLGRVNTLRTLGLAVEVVAAAHGLPMFGAGAKAVGALKNVISGNPSEEDAKALAEGGKQAAGLIDPAAAQTPPEQIDAFRREFAELLGKLNRTLIVFVDNLDRCLPEQTIHTLEALRLFLFMEQSAFVVAADEEMVRNSVARHFGGIEDKHVTDYLDKLIQIPVRVPRLGVAEIRAYLFMLFAEASGVDEKRVSALRGALESNLRLSWSEPPMVVEEALKILEPYPADLRQSFDVAHRMATLLATSTYVNGNPRIVKRMLNVVRLRARVAARRSMPVHEEMVAKFALFERCAPAAAIDRLYALINEAPGGKSDQIAQLEPLTDDPVKFENALPPEWKEAKQDFYRNWFQLKPSLAGVDLRPLIYLSRETSTLRSGSSQLSQAASEAVRHLAIVKTSASKAAQMAIGLIPAGEHAAVMSELIAQMREHTDWSSKPDAFTGAALLADASEPAGEVLGAYLRSLPGKLPWMKVAVGGRAWFKETK